MATDSFARFQDAYLHLLRDIFHTPEFRNAPRGFPSAERLGVSFRLRDPVQRHISVEARKSNLVFCFAEALWYLSGSDDLQVIAYYAPSIAKYSANGHTLAGTAYGPRIFKYPGVGVDQWASVLQTLHEDRDSKRAVIQIFSPQELLVPGNIDVACTLALQFLVREDRLSGVGFMRANDAFRGVVSDVFSFTFLLELMARQLGLQVGTYSHHVGSMHVYDSDAAWAGRVLAEAAEETQPATDFPAMPPGDNWPHVREVLRWETRLRLDLVQLSPAQLDALDLPDYWKQVVGLFEAYRQVRHGTSPNPAVLDALPECYRRAVSVRWPQQFGLAKARP